MTQAQYDFVMNDWVPALRSGKYQQGRGVLRTLYNKFCCLGVACDLYAKQNGKRWRRGVRDWTFQGDADFPKPDWLYELTGLPKSHFRMSAKDLARLNDNGASFEEIATKIETWAKAQPITTEE